MFASYKIPFLLIMAGLIPAFIMPIFARWKKEWCAPFAILVSGALFSISLYLFVQVLRIDSISYGVGGWPPPLGDSN